LFFSLGNGYRFKTKLIGTLQKSGEIRRKVSKSAPEIRRFLTRRKVSKSGDPWSKQEIW